MLPINLSQNALRVKNNENNRLASEIFHRKYIKKDEHDVNPIFRYRHYSWSVWLPHPSRSFHLSTAVRHETHVDALLTSAKRPSGIPKSLSHYI